MIECNECGDEVPNNEMIWTAGICESCKSTDDEGMDDVSPSVQRSMEIKENLGWNEITEVDEMGRIRQSKFDNDLSIEANLMVAAAADLRYQELKGGDEDE